jgi:energy-coupling factor transport system permease protein
MSTLFRYDYHPTIIHALNPLSKLLLFSSFLFLSAVYMDPRVKIPMLAILVAILVTAKLNLASYRWIILLASFAVLLGESYAAFLMVNPDYFKVYDRVWVSTEIFQITPPDFPVFGRSAVTYGVLLYLACFPLQIIPVLLAVAGLLHTTSLGEIVSVLSWGKAPFPAIFMTTVALRFVPEIVQNISLTQRAQSLRGWTMETRNPIKMLALLKPLLVPITRNVIRSVDVMTMSTKNRAFGLGPVTPTTGFSFRTADYVVCTTVVVVIIAGVYAAFALNFGSI